MSVAMIFFHNDSLRPFWLYPVPLFCSYWSSRIFSILALCLLNCCDLSWSSSLSWHFCSFPLYSESCQYYRPQSNAYLQLLGGDGQAWVLLLFSSLISATSTVVHNATFGESLNVSWKCYRLAMASTVSDGKLSHGPSAKCPTDNFVLF